MLTEFEQQVIARLQSIECLVGRIAVSLAKEEVTERPHLVDAAALARMLSVSRATVYQYANELGAIQVGGGQRPRLRFDAEAAVEAWASRTGTPTPTAPHRTTTKGSPAHLTKPGTVLSVKPIRV